MSDNVLFPPVVGDAEVAPDNAEPISSINIGRLLF